MSLAQELAAALPKYWPLLLALAALTIALFANTAVRLIQLRTDAGQLVVVPWYANAAFGVATLAVILAGVAVAGAVSVANDQRFHALECPHGALHCLMAYP